ncbi:ABC transporter permease [Feifania hominis]|uniref:ABC transporter permease n=1 Tax=Feifania hominis TaxID=2763660 RepID=A0A926HVR5_9FIRM|nr:ABC transporter permease [Feifania hominis]MBC8536901.1 ABC transporter permease [Feifania hominis]
MKHKLHFKADRDFVRMLIVTIIIFAAMTAMRPNLFLKTANFVSMGYQLPELGLYSLAFMVVLITGQFNLSIVATGNLCCITGMMVMHQAVEKNLTGGAAWGYIFLGCLAAIAVGLVCGWINGFVVTYFNVPAMLVTMSTTAIFTGIAIIITQGKAMAGVPDELVYFGNHTLLGIPYALWLLIAVFALTAVLINRTSFGFKLKFVGSNLKASHYTGININKIRIRAYVYSGLISALCAIEILAHTNAAKADYAESYVGQAILCSVLGATSPNGGYVRMACMALSMLSLQFLSSGFTMLRLGGYFKEFAWGILLIAVLSFNFISQELRRRKSIQAVAKARVGQKS